MPYGIPPNQRYECPMAFPQINGMNALWHSPPTKNYPVNVKNFTHSQISLKYQGNMVSLQETKKAGNYDTTN